MTDFTYETDDRAYEIGGKIEGILDALDLGDRDSLVAVLEEMHPADIADSLEQIELDARSRLLEYWGQTWTDESCRISTRAFLGN